MKKSAVHALAALLSSASGNYRCVGCTATSALPVMVRSGTFGAPRLVRFVRWRQRLAIRLLWPSASTSIASCPKVQRNTLPA